MSILSQLREMTTIVEDTGDIELIKKHKPRDATTNPSLLLAAAQLPQYQYLVEDAIQSTGDDLCNQNASLRSCLEILSVNFGKEILSIVPGRVSVEVDSTLSFDVEGTMEAARRIIRKFEKQGIDRSRILIKIAATWEGIKAAQQLEKERIHCNLTLLFGFSQAVACAEANVTLISPFVGRILDWFKEKQRIDNISPEDDPGVISVKRIYNYYKKFDYGTEIMGASFRNIGEIIELAGCDLLTISPKLLEELECKSDNLEKKLDPANAKKLDTERISLNEKTFRWMLNEDPMATEKLSEGIRKFTSDLDRLSDFIREKHCGKL
ncbi:transaldolase [bacterium]|nr:transaldolase [bacterium]